MAPSEAKAGDKTQKKSLTRCGLATFDLMGCGERGIRTPGASQHDGFQDRCNRPLYHLSLLLTGRFPKSECKGNMIFQERRNNIEEFVLR